MTYQQTGSTSTMSLALRLAHVVVPPDSSCKYLGQTVRGALLNMERMPVGVGLGVVPVQDVVGSSPSPLDSVAAADAVPVSSGLGLVKLSDGQHSGRSSEQPTNG